MILELTDALLIFIAALFAGGLNAVAGGGTFFAFPALLAVGVPPIMANATCAVAVWPGSLASVFGYRHELTENLRALPWMVGIGLAGGLIGAWALLQTPEQTFELMIPWLLLGATLLFALGKRLPKMVSSLGEGHPRFDPFRRALSGMLQLAIAVYGGFFGAGMGILLLAMLQLLGLQNIHRMNAVKTVIATGINGAAVLIFVMFGAVSWPHGSVMIVGGILGGYFGAKLALKVRPDHVRAFVIAVGLLMSAHFFLRYYG